MIVHTAYRAHSRASRVESEAGFNRSMGYITPLEGISGKGFHFENIL